MKPNESFYATILFGALAILAMMFAAYMLDHAVAAVLTVMVAGLSYATQAATTTRLYHEELARETHIDDYEGQVRLLTLAMRWHKIAVALWIATLVAGALVALFLIAAVL